MFQISINFSTNVNILVSDNVDWSGLGYSMTLASCFLGTFISLVLTGKAKGGDGNSGVDVLLLASMYICFGDWFTVAFGNSSKVR
jgi:hypothetical protein